MVVRSLVGLAVLAAACGSVSVSTHGDGGSGADARIDAPPGIATVTVVDDMDRPIADVHVLFHGPDAAVIADEVTGPDGVASATVPSGSMVTALTMNESGPRAISILGVEGGDQLTIPFRGGGLSTRVGSLQVSFPSTNPAGAASFRHNIGCTEGGVNSAGTVPPPQTLDLYSDCVRQGNVISVLGVALDSAMNPLAFSYATDVALSGQVPTLMGSVALPAWRSDWANLTVQLTNIPAGTTTLEPELRLFRHGLGFDVGTREEIMNPDVAASVPFRYVPGFASHVQYSTFVVSGPAGSEGARIWGKVSSNPPTSDSGDLSMLLPPITGTTFSTEAGTVRAGWTAASPLAADAIFVFLAWDLTTMSMHGEWMFLGPSDLPDSVTVPALPPAYAGWTPPDSTNPPSVIAIELSNVDSYQDLKTNLGPGLFGDDLPPGEYTFIGSLAGIF